MTGWSERMAEEKDPGGRLQTRQLSTFSDPPCRHREKIARAETQRGGLLPPYKKEPEVLGKYRCLTIRVPHA
jgi:hypothetical protein